MLPRAWPVQRLWNWDREGLQLHGAGTTGLIGTTAATTAITIGRAGVLTTFPGDLQVDGLTTLVGGEIFDGLVTIQSAAGAGAAGALGPEEVRIETDQAATAGATIRNPGYIGWRAHLWDGAATTQAAFGRFGGVVDTQAAGVASTYRMVWTDTAGAIQWSASEVGATAQIGNASIADGAAIVSGTALTGTGAMGLASAGAGSVTLASAAGTLLTGTSAGAVTLDPLTTLTLELTDNTAGALVAAEGARDYIRIGTLDAGAAMALGNAATNPTLQVLGSGQITLTGNVDALAGLDTTAITTSAQAALAVGPFGAAAGNTGEARFLELAASGANYVGFKAADALAGDVIWTLPSADAAVAGAALTSNAAGVLSFTAAPAALANERYVIIGPAVATLSDERVLTGTANQVVVTDNGAGGTVVLSTPQDLHTAATPTFSAGTYTPGAAHVAFTLSPTWTAEDFAHTALGVTATQNGANSSTLTGVNVAMVKATAATTLAEMTAWNIPLPTIAGTVTDNRGIRVANQGGAGVSNGYAIDIDSQTVSGGVLARAVRINGTGVFNALQLDTSAGGRRKYFYSSGVGTVNLTGDADTGGFQFTTAAAGGAMGIAAVGANSSLSVDANGTGAASFGTVGSAHTTTLGSTNTTAATTIQAGTGAMIFTAGGIWDVNATGAVTIDGTTFGFTGTSYTFNGTGGVGIGEAPTAHIALTANGGGALSANQSMRHLYASGNVTEAAAGTHGDIVGLYVNNFTVTDGGGVEAVGVLAGIYVVGPPIAGTAPANGPYSFFVDAGTTRLDGLVSCGGALTTGALAAGAHSLTATTFDLNASGVVTLDGAGNSNFTAASGNLTLSTTTSGVLALSSAQTAGNAITGATGAGAANVAGGDYAWTGGVGGATAGAGAAGRGGQWAATMGTGGDAGAGAGAAGAGGLISWIAGTGGVASATGAAGAGGTWTLRAGAGGAGSAAFAGGNGAQLTLASGLAGASGGAGAGTDGAISIDTGGTARIAITGAGAHSYTALTWAVTATSTAAFAALSGTFTQTAQVAPAGVVAWAVTAGAHTAIATAADFTGALLTLAASWTLADGATVTDGQAARFAAPTFVGLAGGGTETVTNPATVYIPAAPTNGGNVTFTNPAAALRLGGALRMEARVLGNQGADVASANDLTLGLDGNCFEITGAVQINAVTTADWQNGSLATLVFASTPTVKHNTVGGAGTAVLLLAAGADFAATAGDTLTLILSEQGGTQAWREVARTAI